MPNVRASSGMIGTTRGPMFGILEQRAQESRERRGRRRLHLLAGAGASAAWMMSSGGNTIVFARSTSVGQESGERPPALHQVLVLG